MASTDKGNLAFNIFLYWFIGLKKIDPGFSQKFVESLNSYSLDDRKMIEEALLWGKDLQEITSRFPLADEINIPGEEIRQELFKILEILKLK